MDRGGDYFFRLSRYQAALEKLYTENRFCEPEHFRNEVLAGWATA